jgi:hypothetical protein
VVVIARPAPIVTLNVWVAEEEAELVTLTVKLNDPAAVGVPVIAPELNRFSPEGRAPEIRVQTYPLPPVAASVCEYGTLTVPEGKVAGVVIVTGVEPPPPLALELGHELAGTVPATTQTLSSADPVVPAGSLSAKVIVVDELVAVNVKLLRTHAMFCDVVLAELNSNEVKLRPCAGEADTTKVLGWLPPPG